MAEIIDSPLHAGVEGGDLQSWVMEKVDQWRTEYRTNHADKHDEYYRMFRGIWAEEDKTRSTERSRIVSPAIQQAVESNVAEIEEATFGRGKFFDIEDDPNDTLPADVAKLREQMHADFTKLKTKQAIAECILNAAIFGTGIGEIVLDTIKETVPATEPSADGSVNVVGVRETERTITKLIPVMPKHFLIDGAASSIDEALGCAIDKYVPTHTIEQLQESGVYQDVEVQTDITNTELEADRELEAMPKGQTRLTKYFGLVPRTLLDDAQTSSDEVVESLSGDSDSFYVEAIVIISDGTGLLKAEENPNMMGDRNVVAFQWDKVPSQFAGRGTVEKGYNSQKALDAEMRARIDALGLTVHPMLGMDASRMPRGARPTVQPGKIILTNGNPQEVLHPFNFGNVNQITFPQAQALNSMVQQATGAIDITPGAINADQSNGAMSQSTSGIVKRHKRTQLNFEESFLIPFITKVGWRYMQYEPEMFPAKDMTFIVKGSLGIVAREYEVAQLVQLLQVMGDDNPAKPIMIKAIVDHMGVSNREEIGVMLDEAAQPSEEEAAAEKANQEAAMAFQQSQTDALNGQAAESNGRAKKYEAETRAVPVQLENDRIKIIASMDDDDEKNFNRRMSVADLALREKKMGLGDISAKVLPQPTET